MFQWWRSLYVLCIYMYSKIIYNHHLLQSSNISCDLLWNKPRFQAISKCQVTSTPEKDPSAISGIIYIYISCVCPIFMLFTVSGVGIYPIYNHVYYQQLLYSFLKFQIPLTSLFPFHGIFWGVPRKKTKKQLPPRCLGHRGGIGSGSFASLLRLVNCAFKVPKSSPSCQIRTSWQEWVFSSLPGLWVY